jgi:V8-like Glu-specific endopeptidase
MFSFTNIQLWLVTKSRRLRAVAAATQILLGVVVICASGSHLIAQQPGKPSRKEAPIVSVPDNRVLVADTTKFPFSAIVKLRVKFRDGSRAEGSGALIGPNKVLTADHVVHDSSISEDAVEIEVLPGYSNNETSCKRTVAVSFSHGTHDGCHRGAECDIAIINTRDSLGCDTGWFGFKPYTTNDLKQVFVAGYPDDLSGGEKMYFVNTTTRHRSNSKFHNSLMYRDWTYGGMSGGPIFTSDYYIVGIHTEGSSEANFGVGICDELYSELLKWLQELDAKQINFLGGLLTSS